MKYIGFFGRTNTGKSSIINTFSGQDIAIVSPRPGTTTDPIKKRMEIKGLGVCQLVDTAGVGDLSELGEKREDRTMDMISKVDIAVLVFAGNVFDKYEHDLLHRLREAQVPVLLVHNQEDLFSLNEELESELLKKHGLEVLRFSCSLLEEREQSALVGKLRDALVELSLQSKYRELTIFEGLLGSHSEEVKNVVLVCPIDSQAPTGRLILPQVMAIRDLLDKGAVATVLQLEQLSPYLEKNPKPYLCVTDSQVFSEVASILPQDVALTSFSMLLARSKGNFTAYAQGTNTISTLRDGDRVLILESCTHHASCEDIGRVKLPKLMRKFTGKDLEFVVVPGLDKLPSDLESFALVVQCGACVITAKQLFSRIAAVERAEIPVTNYGMALAYMNGIFERALRPLTRYDE